MPKTKTKPKPNQSNPPDTDNPDTEEMAELRRILLISLGNPGPKYAHTYHSAGHIVLSQFQSLLGRDQPSLSTQRIGGQPTPASIGHRYTLLQSPTLMNVSGPWVAKAYREHLREQGLAPSELGVVLVHDDMEVELGAVKVRDWARSHRGHNGVRSVNATLKPDPAGKWARVSIGIGRPEARDRSTVSDYVLSRMKGGEQQVLARDGAAGLWSALAELETKWGAR